MKAVQRVCNFFYKQDVAASETQQHGFIGLHWKSLSTVKWHRDFLTSTMQLHFRWNGRHTWKRCEPKPKLKRLIVIFEMENVYLGFCWKKSKCSLQNIEWARLKWRALSKPWTTGAWSVRMESSWIAFSQLLGWAQKTIHRPKDVQLFPRNIRKSIAHRTYDQLDEYGTATKISSIQKEKEPGQTWYGES